MKSKDIRLNSLILKNRNSHLLLKSIMKNKVLYLFLAPAFIYIIIFNYIPMYGVQIAFRDFIPFRGIWGSPWVGLKHFTIFSESYSFWILIRNTIVLSAYQLIVGFPFPIMLALIINYTPSLKLKKITQNMTYAPYFISVVVLVGMMFVFLSPSGIINTVLNSLGLKRFDFISDPGSFRHLYVWSGVWQTTGMASVIYLAILTSVSPELHEAAIVDGANKLQRIWHIDLVAIMPTAIILLILASGNIMSVGFEKTFLMQNSPNLSTSEVISTYVYKIGILRAQYSYAAAIGLFNNVINFIILVILNKLANKFTSGGLW
jgi:putative aldouronate transport system permease protein